MIHTFPRIATSPLPPLDFRTDLLPSPNPGLITLRFPTLHDYRTGRVLAGLGNTKWQLPRSYNPTAVATTAIELESAAEVVRKFYGGINNRDLTSVEDLISHNCIYEDLVFPRPFVGRKEILEFFKKFMDCISKDLQFVIDDISGDDTCAVGVTWHLEWKGKPFSFSKGCSFYRLDVVEGQRQIVYGRDVVEPAIKPGEAALAAIRGVTWLLQNFPFLAERL